jgi:hypothetical protein
MRVLPPPLLAQGGGMWMWVAGDVGTEMQFYLCVELHGMQLKEASLRLNVTKKRVKRRLLRFCG